MSSLQLFAGTSPIFLQGCVAAGIYFMPYFHCGIPQGQKTVWKSLGINFMPVETLGHLPQLVWILFLRLCRSYTKCCRRNHPFAKVN